MDRGTRGRGAGEYEGDLSIAALPADSVLVYDWFARRLTVLAPDGATARTAAVEVTRPNLDLVGALGDGSIVMSARHLHLTPGVNVDSVEYFRATTQGRFLGTLGSVEGARVFMAILGGMPAIDDQPFTPVPRAATRAGRLMVLEGGAPRVLLFHPAAPGAPGSAPDTLRWDASPRPVSDALAASWRDRALRTSTVPAPVRQAWIDQVPLPVNLPAADGLAPGPDGRIWVREWTGPDADTAEWSVLEPGRGVVASVRLSARFDLRVVGDDLLVGVERDADDVERVVAYRRRR